MPRLPNSYCASLILLAALLPASRAQAQAAGTAVPPRPAPSAQDTPGVDAVFTNVLTDTTAPTVTAKSPAAGATGVGLASAVTATFSESVQSSSIVFGLKDAGGVVVGASVSYDDAAKTTTLQPTNALTMNTTYTATLSGAKDAAGNVMATVTWTFTTVGSDTTAPTVVGKSPAANATAVAPATMVTATFSESVPST